MTCAQLAKVTSSPNPPCARGVYHHPAPSPRSWPEAFWGAGWVGAERAVGIV